MLKIKTVEDVRNEYARFIATMRSIPEPKRPGLAQNGIWRMMQKYNDNVSPDDLQWEVVTPDDITDCWFVVENWLPLLNKFEKELLYARLKSRPIPWKILEYNLNFTRQMLNLYMNKALLRIYETLYQNNSVLSK
ncbi:MAG: hypothetical protein IJ660_00890 [Alphaproteobacteria bacterium]|nr:hypothetical protein [Alphaproteobacteria bacterium]